MGSSYSSALATCLIAYVHTSLPSCVAVASEDARTWYNSSREAPQGYEPWVAFARENRCAQGPYNFIEQDLLPFRDLSQPQRRTITKELVNKAKDFALGPDAHLFRYLAKIRGALYIGFAFSDDIPCNHVACQRH